MINHISILTLVAMVVILMLMIAAVYTWLLYRLQSVRYRAVEKTGRSIILDLRNTAGNVVTFDRKLAKIQDMKLPETSPWFSTLQWAVPRNFTRKDCRQQLVDTIQRYYSALSQQIEWIKSIAPPTGLLFTVLGLMVVLFKQSQGLDHQQMLGDIGVALFTTAFSSMVLILQVTLLSKLNALKEQEYQIGMMLIDTLFYNENDFKEKREITYELDER